MKMSYDILQVSKRCQEAQSQGFECINGTVGMLFDDDRKLVSFDEVNEYITSNFTKNLGYASQLGPEDFKEGTLKRFFGKSYQKLIEKHNICFAPTAGGTGALFYAFKAFNKTHTLLMPAPFWPNYTTIAEEADINFVSYSAFKNNKFDFEELQKQIDSIEGNVLLVINDPCQNPSGYNFSEEEYQALFKILIRYGSKIEFLLDIAYLDYSPNKNNIVDFIVNSDIKDHFHLLFSTSKSFGFYGLRLGGIISLFDKNDQENYAKFSKKMMIFTRGIISSPNNVVMNGLALFFKDRVKREIIKQKILEETRRVESIGKMLVETLDKKEIKHSPYSCGFYITFEVEDSAKYLDFLESKHVYFSMIDEHNIRIAICSMNTFDVKKLSTIL